MPTANCITQRQYFGKEITLLWSTVTSVSHFCVQSHDFPFVKVKISKPVSPTVGPALRTEGICYYPSALILVAVTQVTSASHGLFPFLRTTAFGIECFSYGEVFNNCQFVFKYCTLMCLHEKKAQTKSKS